MSARVGPARRHDAVRIIEAKRDGRELDDDEIDWIVEGFTSGAVAPEQMSALAMAIYFRGMTDHEISRWTSAMVRSGTRLDLSTVTRGDAVVPTVDKHSTGGVGDAITLVLTPLLATWDVAVPQLSGRGLGHTGGTLDRLESIPGWRADLDADELRAVLTRTGAVICAAGADLAPADRALYALRDVTGTVASIPMIAASIMSKKIAEGTGALVLDVKFGSGAFLPAPTDARELARVMVGIGAAAGVRTSALVTANHTPLGRAVGNALEVAEAREILAGGGPADMVDLTCALALEALAAVGIPDADPRARLADGRAMDAYRAMISAQGGDPDAVPPRAAHVAQVRAPASGPIRWDALGVGRASWLSGAGRTGPGETVDHAAGVLLDRVEGEVVSAGDVVASVHAGDAARLPAAVDELRAALGTGPGRGPAGEVADRLRGW
ncbi:thymidine phosphorylase [Dietzia cinnamea]|uniref:Thymidine phosphorylase n=2 Tax=Dietzia TaxID=37914 RepID=A0AAW5QAJ2_9ACTN|nr:thymidine phosphorylase [Dietzia cinnamea]MCT1640414.1 thymidine phosphorylase [Dietzia cinnamea]MCT1864434.1 thymidine phosphorylase [Dietzia cinnamea]MCT2031320.1 thymidine phosphorylase [Dietzia cinnamea]MCT2033826.1 thymidine phosphorylase [Dietzia cinnamea]MCT2076800.1 thymidine phosphorylase [Dietzia cinnamea]